MFAWTLSRHAVEQFQHRFAPDCLHRDAERMLRDAADVAYEIGPAARGKWLYATPAFPRASLIVAKDPHGGRTVVTVVDAVERYDTLRIETPPTPPAPPADTDTGRYRFTAIGTQEWRLDVVIVRRAEPLRWIVADAYRDDRVYVSKLQSRIKAEGAARGFARRLFTRNGATLVEWVAR